MKEFLLPLVVLAILSTIVLPVPAGVLDFLLVGNVIISMMLLVSSLYISDPLKISSLPSILLLATLYRLVLNISTTRKILAGEHPGQMIEAFGSVVVQDNLVVGLIIFLIITLVQFIVITKGSERVAEVSARFTLDALPGKQMSIDADVRAGVIDIDEARKKRQELQIESRFYGALDGAMKFVKGDAIAGIIITALNLLGGISLGIFSHNLSIGQSVNRYSLLSIGDGLISQVPALCTALAAGMIVTRVTRGDQSSLALELLTQFNQIRAVKLIIAGLSILLAFAPGLPCLPFLSLTVLLVFCSLKNTAADELSNTQKVIEQARFVPQAPGLLMLQFSRASMLTASSSLAMLHTTEQFRARIYEQSGLIILPPQITVGGPADPEGSDACKVRFYIRGILTSELEVVENQSESWSGQIAAELDRLLASRAVEFVDDIMTRRLLDNFERQAPELVANVVPEIASVTQITEVLRNLVKEQVSIRNFDLILQVIAEQGARSKNSRELLEEVRIGLKRVLAQSLPAQLNVIRLEPALDLLFLQSERTGRLLAASVIESVAEQFLDLQQSLQTAVILCSKGGRLLLRECLELKGLRPVLLALEVITEETELSILGTIKLAENDLSEDMIGEILAA